MMEEVLKESLRQREKELHALQDEVERLTHSTRTYQTRGSAS